MSALVVLSDGFVDQLRSLKLVVEDLRREVCDRRAENADLGKSICDWLRSRRVR